MVITASGSFPVTLLSDCSSALLLFGCGKGGEYDGRYVRDAGVTDVTVVDHHRGLISAMRPSYPDEWLFVRADAWRFARSCRRRFDLVSVDPPSGPISRTSTLDVVLWAGLAERHLLIGHGVDMSPVPPRGWELRECIQRSGYLGGWFWTVFGRQA